MKAIISLSLLLWLSAVSCKKEIQKTTPVNTDTYVMDSMNTNSIPPDTAGITSNAKDSITTINMKDSVGVRSK